MTARIVSSKNKRRRIRALMQRHDGRCHWCGSHVKPGLDQRAPELATLDHVVPQSRGGPNALTNLVLACNRCNSRRGDMPADEWHESRGWEA